MVLEISFNCFYGVICTSISLLETASITLLLPTSYWHSNSLRSPLCFPSLCNLLARLPTKFWSFKSTSFFSIVLSFSSILLNGKSSLPSSPSTRCSCSSKYSCSYNRLLIKQYTLVGTNYQSSNCAHRFEYHNQLKMSQKRRASRHSIGDETLSRLKCFEALVGFNPYLIQEQVERTFKESLRRMLDDFIKTMVQHDLAQEMAGFRVEEHIASAVTYMELQLDKFSQWIENFLVNKEEIRKAKEALDRQRHIHNDKLKAIMALVVQLTNSIRDKRVQELERFLEAQVEKHRIHEIKNIYEYDRALSLQEKYQKQYDEHLEKVRQKYEKVCGKYEAKYSNH